MSSYAMFVDTLERTSHKHAEIIEKLDRIVKTMSYGNVGENVELIEYYLNELRKIRNEISAAISSIDDNDNIWEDRYAMLRDVLGVLSEYMVAIGLEYEKQLLEDIIKIGTNKGIISVDLDSIRNDIDSIASLQEKLEKIVKNFYQ